MKGGFCSNQSWGGGGCRGIYVVVTVGDDVQLPPVLDHPVYNCTERHQQACMGYLYVGVSGSCHCGFKCGFKCHSGLKCFSWTI